MWPLLHYNNNTFFPFSVYADCAMLTITVPIAWFALPPEFIIHKRFSKYTMNSRFDLYAESSSIQVRQNDLMFFPSSLESIDSTTNEFNRSMIRKWVRLHRPLHDIFQFFIIHLSWSQKWHIQITFQVRTISTYISAKQKWTCKIVSSSSCSKFNTSPAIRFAKLYSRDCFFFFFKLFLLKSINCLIWSEDLRTPSKHWTWYLDWSCLGFGVMIERKLISTRNDSHSWCHRQYHRHIINVVLSVHTSQVGVVACE